MIHCIRKCAEYITAYAYVYIGIHGYNFCTAGGKVATLFAHHGLTMAGTARCFTQVHCKVMSSSSHLALPK